MSKRVPKKREACKETSPMACSHHQPQMCAPVADTSSSAHYAQSGTRSLCGYHCSSNNIRRLLLGFLHALGCGLPALGPCLQEG